jgi:hypothetical protein
MKGRNRLDTIPAAHLLLVARKWLFYGDENESSQHVFKVLESAARLDRTDYSEEAAWLLKKMQNTPKISNSGAKKWLAEITKGDDSVWAKYYQGTAMLLSWAGGDAAEKQLRKAIEAGFAPAMSILGEAISLYEPENEEGSRLLHRAVELGDPDGMYCLSALPNIDLERRFSLLKTAAEVHGHLDSMFLLTSSGYSDYSHFLSPIEEAVFAARYTLLSGSNRYYLDVVSDAIRQLDANWNGIDSGAFQMLYVSGRELQGYHEFWDNGRHPKMDYCRCIDIYERVVQRARTAALQTILCLRSIVGKDVACLIGKTIYQRRETDAIAWYSPSGPNIKKLKR